MKKQQEEVKDTAANKTLELKVATSPAADTKRESDLPPPPPTPGVEDVDAMTSLRKPSLPLPPPPPTEPRSSVVMRTSTPLPPPPPSPPLSPTDDADTSSSVTSSPVSLVGNRQSSFNPPMPDAKARLQKQATVSEADSIAESATEQRSSCAEQFKITAKPKRQEKEFKVAEYLNKPPLTQADSLKKVNTLDDVPMRDTDCCSLDGGSVGVHYEASTDTAFMDIDGFAIGQAQFIEEARRQARLVCTCTHLFNQTLKYTS